MCSWVWTPMFNTPQRQVSTIFIGYHTSINKMKKNLWHLKVSCGFHATIVPRTDFYWTQNTKNVYPFIWFGLPSHTGIKRFKQLLGWRAGGGWVLAKLCQTRTGQKCKERRRKKLDSLLTSGAMWGSVFSPRTFCHMGGQDGNQAFDLGSEVDRSHTMSRPPHNFAMTLLHLWWRFINSDSKIQVQVQIGSFFFPFSQCFGLVSLFKKSVDAHLRKTALSSSKPRPSLSGRPEFACLVQIRVQLTFSPWHTQPIIWKYLNSDVAHDTSVGMRLRLWPIMGKKVVLHGYKVLWKAKNIMMHLTVSIMIFKTE